MHFSYYLNVKENKDCGKLPLFYLFYLPKHGNSDLPLQVMRHKCKLNLHCSWSFGDNSIATIRINTIF